jgi:hypothetical protein
VKEIVPEETDEMYEDAVVPPDSSNEPDWARPPPDLYEDTELAPPLRPPKLQPQKLPLYPVPKPQPPSPTDTYEDTLPPPPPPIADEIYDENAIPTTDDFYDETAVPVTPSRPQAKLPPVTQPQVKPGVQSRPPAPEPIQEEIYDDNDVPPPLPTSKLPALTTPAHHMQTRPPATPPPEVEEDDEYDDVATFTPRQKPPKSTPTISKPTVKISDHPGIEDHDRMYLSQWDHSSIKNDELCMKRGDMVCVLDKMYRDWWVGRIGEKVGLVPQIYLVKAYDLCIE